MLRSGRRYQWCALSFRSQLTNVRSRCTENRSLTGGVIGGSNAYRRYSSNPDKAELYSRVSLDLEHENAQIDKTSLPMTSWWLQFPLSGGDQRSVSRSSHRPPPTRPLVRLMARAASAREAESWKFYRSPLTIVFTKSLRPNIELILEHQAKWQTVIQDLRSSRGRSGGQRCPRRRAMTRTEGSR
jgi:hypothetical protein